MNEFSSIWLDLDIHRDTINEIVADYRNIDKKNKENYSDNFYQKQKRELVAKYQSKISKEKEKTGDSVNFSFYRIQTTLQKWISAPLAESKANILRLFKEFDLEMNKSEIEIMQEAIGDNYLGNRVLSALAARNGIHIKAKPNIETYERVLKDCISTGDLFLKGFYGSTPAWDLVPASVSKNIVVAAAAGTMLKDGCSLHKAALLWDGSSAPCPKTIITADDQEVLAKLYSGCTDDAAKAGRTKELIDEMPELRNILMLTEYSPYVGE